MTTAKEFASYAESLCGDTGKSYQSRFGLPHNSPWSASFVSSCLSNFQDVSNVIKSSKCSDFEKLASSDKVKWIPGPAYKGNTNPKTGDIALICWSSKQSGSVNSIGIVRRFNQKDGTIDIVSGDVGASSMTSLVSMRTYSSSLSCIKGYIRLNQLQ